MKIRIQLLIIMLLAVTLTACGRRGDPVLVEPAMKKDAVRQESKGQTPSEPIKVEQQTGAAATPVVPSGLNGVYTQQSVILTWDFIDDPKIKYRIYRSKGDGFELAGESITPAFEDRDVEAGMKYHYRVTAVGASEGPPSKELIIITEIH